MAWDKQNLVEVLKESKEWAACRKFSMAWAKSTEQADDCIVKQQVGQWAREDESFFKAEYRPLLTNLRAVRDEVESGAIYGSPDKCAVCGKPDVRRETWKQPDYTLVSFHVHSNCSGKMSETAESRRLPLAAAILRARRLLADQLQVQPQAAAQPVAVQSELTGKNRGEDACCGNCNNKGRCRDERWVTPGLRTYHGCDLWEPKQTAVAASAPTPPAPPTAQPKIDPYAAQRFRETSAEFLSWASQDAQALATRIAAEKAEASQQEEHRRRVLIGLDRGPDPRILMTGDLIGRKIR